MRESIGLTVLINIVIVFLLATFAFIAGTISYSRGFKANSKVIESLEIYEGYNAESQESMERDLQSAGYLSGNSQKCAERKGSGRLVKSDTEKYKYCIYIYDENNPKYYSFGAVTYMNIDLSMLGLNFDLPVFSRTRRIYRFGE